jgi:hypothetical protein
MADEPNEPTPDNTPNPVFLVDESTKQFFEEYVGPGKKYPNVGELAKAYANADNHIGNLTRDAGKFKTEAESLKELLMENLVQPKPDDDNSNPNPNPNDDAPPAKQPDAAPPKEPEDKSVDVKALVKAALEEVTTEDKRRKNAELTEAASVKHFGSQEDAVKAVSARAEELGVSPQWIANLAFDSPKAYFITMGIDPDTAPKSNNTPAPGSDVNAQRLAENAPGVKPNTYKWYQELRKSNPSKYRSQEVQQAILRDAAANPNFYS